MKTIYAISCLLLFGVSCKKSEETTTTFSFRANGTLFVWNGPSNTQSASAPGGSCLVKASYCMLFASPDNMSPLQPTPSDSYIAILFTTDTTPVVGTYSSTVLGNVTGLQPTLVLTSERSSFPGTYRADNQGDTSMNVTISAVGNGFVSGTFSGLLAPDIHITDGNFNHVPVVP